MIYYYESYKLNRIIKSKILNSNIAVDIGCGIRPSKFIRSKIHICIEPFKDYVEVIKQKYEFENYVILQDTWENCLSLFPDKSVDIVIFSDVIEHLSKDDGFSLIKESCRIAKSQVAFFTPLGFMPQIVNSDNSDAWGLKGGEFQEHKSGWLPEEFDNSWDFFVSKEYHFFDHSGKKFEKPYGAFWAIKNFDYTSNKKEKILYFLNKSIFKLLGKWKAIKFYISLIFK